MLGDEQVTGWLVAVAGFGAQLERDPESGAELEHGNLYSHEIPGSEHDGWIVTIEYTLQDSRDDRFAGEVWCQSVSCIRHPVRELLPRHPAPKHH